MWFSVVLNVNLAILNMLPFPVLDGGHIVMALYEWVRRQPIHIRLLEVMQTACVLLLLGFMVFVSLKDVGDLFGVGKKGDSRAEGKGRDEVPGSRPVAVRRADNASSRASLSHVRPPHPPLLPRPLPLPAP